jgi:hypothetical protein
MTIILVLIAVLFCIAVVIFRPEQRKPYNEFRRPAATATASAVYGDAGAPGIACGGMEGGGGGCDGGGGGGAC